MIAWWNSLPVLGQIFAAVAIPATLIMIIQTILLFFGLGGHGDGDIGGGHMDIGGGHMDISGGHGDIGGHLETGHGDSGHMGGAHHDGAGHSDFSLITVRGIVAFFAVGGWLGVVCISAGLTLFWALLLALAAGFIALLGVALILYGATKLRDSGNLEIENAVGKTGSVYIPVPPKGQGRGKINVLVQDRLVELEAVNEGDTELPTGAVINVVAVLDEQTVAVKADTGPYSPPWTPRRWLADNTAVQTTQKNEGGISKWVQQD
ncbi:MAG: hypothetical protein FWC62_04355 [Firmicutes bacterium]|nr:hypothetical protein [Bacillota bacterium]